VKGIADTGFIVAFLNRRDKHHDWAAELATQISPPLLTCDPVLAEAAFHLQDCATVIKLIETGLLLPALEVSEHTERLIELAQRFADRKPDLADLCLIRLSELNPRHRVITVDVTDFNVYRRNRKDLIPLICPPTS
jgi:predicted nucleic acid-binding protein